MDVLTEVTSNFVETGLAINAEALIKEFGQNVIYDERARVFQVGNRACISIYGVSSFEAHFKEKVRFSKVYEESFSENMEMSPEKAKEAINNIRQALKSSPFVSYQLVNLGLFTKVVADLIKYEEEGNSTYRLKIDRLALLICSILSDIQLNFGNFKYWEKYDKTVDTYHTGWFNRKHTGGKSCLLDANQLIQLMTQFGYIVKVGECFHSASPDTSFRNIRERFTILPSVLKYMNTSKFPSVIIIRDKKEVLDAIRKIDALSALDVVRLGTIASTGIDKEFYEKARKRVSIHANIVGQVMSNEDIINKQEAINKLAFEAVGEDISFQQALLVRRIQESDVLGLLDSFHVDNYGGRSYDVLSQLKSDYRHCLRALPYAYRKAILFEENNYDDEDIIRDASIEESNSKDLVEVDISEMNFYILLERFYSLRKSAPITQEACKKNQESLLALLKASSEGRVRSLIVEAISNHAFIMKYLHMIPDHITIVLEDNSEISGAEYKSLKGEPLPIVKAYYKEGEALNDKDYCKKFCLVAGNSKSSNMLSKYFDKALKKLCPYFGEFWAINRKGLFTEDMSACNPLFAQAAEVEFMYGSYLYHDISTSTSNDISEYSSRRIYDKPGVAQYLMTMGVTWFKINHDSVWIPRTFVKKAYEAIKMAAKVRNFEYLPCVKVEGFSKDSVAELFDSLTTSELMNSEKEVRKCNINPISLTSVNEVCGTNYSFSCRIPEVPFIERSLQKASNRFPERFKTESKK